MTNHMLQKNAAKGSNTVISPSFHFLLSLIPVGSKGRKLEQLLYCLGSRSIKDLNSLSSQMLALASPGMKAITLVDQEMIKGVYNAIAKKVDFVNKADEVVAEINSWAETGTRGLIKNVLIPEALESVTEDTALILANALYFESTWAQSFDTSKTENRTFYLLNNQTVHVPFMTSVEFGHYHYRCFDDAIDGLQKLVQLFKFNPEYFNQRFDLHLEDISDFWIPSKNADITEMVDSLWGLYVEKMFHKSFIEVNEEGTKAAACSVAITKTLCLRFVGNWHGVDQNLDRDERREISREKGH
ncbi:hypothetical protein CRYUN_Cryun01aG0108300 [Craigia yunnanensis]